MKKKKLIGILLAIFSLGFMTNVKAEELTSDFIDVNNFCVVKEENKLAVKFDLKKDIDLTNANAMMYINISSADNQSFGSSCFDGVCETDGMVIVPSTTTCSIDKVEGTKIYQNGAFISLTKDMTIAEYYEIINSQEAFINAEGILVDIYIKDQNNDYERIIYNTKEGKIESIEKGHDYISDLVNLIPQKYPSWEAYGGGGDEDTFSMDFRNIGFEEVGIFKTIIITNWQQKTLDEMLKEVAPIFENKEVTIGYETEITKTILENIKQSGYIASVNQYSEEEEPQILYTWTFDGSKIENTDLTIDLALNIGKSTNQEKIESLVSQNRKSLVLEFAHHGELPKGTSVKVNVKDAFENGKKLVLYYYNEKGELEEVAKNLEVKNGYIEFALEHCSDYVLVETTNNAQTGTLNIPFYSTLAVASVIGITYLILKKKKSC